MKATWILVADIARARLLATEPEGARLQQLEHFDNPEGRRKDRAPARDRPPRTMESMGHTRHAIEAHTSEDDKVAGRFARQLADVLERGRDEHRYEELVLVAPPHFMGTLKEALDKQVQHCVVAQVDKDLTADSLDALEARVGELRR